MSSYPRDHKIICATSGFECLRSEARKRWDGLLVRADFWEPRHPQDFIRVHRDNTAVIQAQPPEPDPPLLDPPIDASDVI